MMANKVVGALLLAMAKADFDFDTADLRAQALSSSYTFSTAHDFRDDLTNVISDIVAVTGEAVSAITGGYKLDCDDFTLTTVTGTAAAIAFHDHNGGADSARRYVAFMDTSITGFPVTLSGGSIPVTVNASGVFTNTSA